MTGLITAQRCNMSSQKSLFWGWARLKKDGVPLALSSATSAGGTCSGDFEPFHSFGRHGLFQKTQMHLLCGCLGSRTTATPSAQRPRAAAAEVQVLRPPPRSSKLAVTILVGMQIANHSVTPCNFSSNLCSCWDPIAFLTHGLVRGVCRRERCLQPLTFHPQVRTVRQKLMAACRLQVRTTRPTPMTTIRVSRTMSFEMSRS